MPRWFFIPLVLVLMAPLGISSGESLPPGLELPRERLFGSMELVARFSGAMPTGVTVTPDHRIFVNFPRWGDDVPFTVAEVVNGQAMAYPDESVNREPKEKLEEGFVSVQSVVADQAGRVWILDTGSPEFKLTQYGGPKLIAVDLKTNAIVQKIIFQRDVALPTSYLNDVRFDLKRGTKGIAYITDSSNQGDNAIIVVDLATGHARRRLAHKPALRADPNFVPYVEGRPLQPWKPDGTRGFMTTGSDGIALSHDGKLLYFSPLSSRHLWQVSAEVLSDPYASDEVVDKTLTDLGDRGFASDGLEIDAAGRLFLTDYEHHAIQRRDPDGSYSTVVSDPRILWPDTLSLATDGYLYLMNNQLNRQKQFDKEGKDRREKPYTLWRVKVKEES